MRGSWYRESLGDGHVDLLMGVANVAWRVLDGDRYALRLGAGGRLTDDDIGSLGGWNLTAGLDLYPVQPLLLSVAADYGSLGSAEVVGLRAALGCQVDRFAIEFGWERTSIGDVDLGRALCWPARLVLTHAGGDMPPAGR
ncbi:MAG: hypothetical protein QM757_35190 [Paludibaculum sp.]